MHYFSKLKLKEQKVLRHVMTYTDSSSVSTCRNNKLLGFQMNKFAKTKLKKYKYAKITQFICFIIYIHTCKLNITHFIFQTVFGGSQCRQNISNTRIYEQFTISLGKNWNVHLTYIHTCLLIYLLLSTFTRASAYKCTYVRTCICIYYYKIKNYIFPTKL